ncbi:MAG TPA: energy transducer TonB [Candidatus Acidoferrales bacterium]|jgi:outer membrane biosynthesis protein TonB|nr:energy transducer TonB [Candidatus Acidoferrales bacterium]
MNGKPMRLIAAANLMLAAGLWLCVVKVPGILASGRQNASEDSRAKTTPGQTNAPRESRGEQSPAQNRAANPYKPASAVSAADVQFPFETPNDGIVVFNVSIGPEGQIRHIAVLQDVPPFTAAAEQSLRGWKFAPAAVNGTGENAEMLVAFVFRHSVYVANEPPFRPVLPAKEPAGERQGFTPAGILSATYAAYPASTIAMGAVIVQATVKTDGSAGGVSILRDLPGDFGKLAVNAAKHWKFQAATRDGKPVPTKVAIAFVFSSRALNPF